VNDELQKELEESSRDIILRYYPGIRLEEWRKATKIRQDSLSPGPIFEPVTCPFKRDYIFLIDSL
jgi:hypothetical protein